MKTAMKDRTDRQLLEEMHDAVHRSIPITLIIMSVISFIQFIALLYLLTH